MVTTEKQWFIKLRASLVEFKVTCGVVELLVLNGVGLGHTDISEDVSV